jgi:hypothetical protein
MVLPSLAEGMRGWFARASLFAFLPESSGQIPESSGQIPEGSGQVQKWI